MSFASEITLRFPIRTTRRTLSLLFPLICRAGSTESVFSPER